MADLRLDIAIIPTYNSYTIGVADASKYPSSFVILSPSIEFEIPSFEKVVLPFNAKAYNYFDSTDLGITAEGSETSPLPDGIYKVKYTITPAYKNNVEKTFIRVNNLQERFDAAFMQMDMMECDRAIKMQQKVELNSIYFFIQGAIAAANNCAEIEAMKLYDQASKLLNNFMKNGCECSGTNYVTNFY